MWMLLNGTGRFFFLVFTFLKNFYFCFLLKKIFFIAFLFFFSWA